jgi:hypothetical protein
VLGCLCYGNAGGPQEPKQQADAKAVDEDPNSVAKIGDCVITKEELGRRLMSELHPNPYGTAGQAEPVTAETVLKTMLAERAMVMEGRKQDFLKDEIIRRSVGEYKDRRLVNLLLGRYLESRQGQFEVSDSEIEQKLQTDPKLDRVRAKAMIQRTKVNKLLDEYYSGLYNKLNVQRVSANFAKAAEIHQRLLYRPQKPRTVGWIQNSQVRDELTPEERNIVLATYKNGKVTLEDWLNALCDIVPPGRPRDLDTPQGVGRLLDQAIRMPIFVSEAESLGLDKDAALIKQVIEYEDRFLLGKVQQAKYEEVAEPNEEQIVAYFNENKEAFGTPRRVKIDQIWCQDHKVALDVKAELDKGRDFESVKQEFSLQKNPPHDTYPSGEGMFFQDLWQGDPNQIVGPVKGFYPDGVKWRIVKILEKKPAELKEYSADMKDQVKGRLMDAKRNALLADYRKELLSKYSYEIHADKIKDIDPLDIP